MDFQITLNDQRLEIWPTGAFLGQLPPTLEVQIESLFEAYGLEVRNRFDEDYGQLVLFVDLPVGAKAATLKAKLLQSLSPDGPSEVIEDDGGEVTSERSLILSPDLW